MNKSQICVLFTIHIISKKLYRKSYCHVYSTLEPVQSNSTLFNYNYLASDEFKKGNIIFIHQFRVTQTISNGHSFEVDLHFGRGIVLVDVVADRWNILSCI